MALNLPLRTIFQHGMRLKINFKSTRLRFKCNVHDRIFVLEDNSLDDFTTQLIQKKIEKWSTRKTPKFSVVQINKDSTNVPSLDTSKINILFQEAIENSNNSEVLRLIDHCISHKICPSITYLYYSLSILSQNGEIGKIKEIQDLCKEITPEILTQHSDFKPFLAEAMWIRGNSNDALKLYKEVFKENTFMRRRIRLMIKNLILDVVSKRSEVVLLNLVKFAEELVIDYNDYYILACIWQNCFLSEWFSDQCIALNLLNKYNELCAAVTHRIPYVVAVSLQNHRIEVVYRLLETLLKFEMKSQYSGVLLALLNYQIHQKDIRRCLEIVQWSEQNNVELLPIQHKRYLKLLINYKESNLNINKKKSFTPNNFKF